MKLEDYDNAVLDGINKLTISSKFRILGSQADSKILYSNDYDVVEKINDKNINYEEFKNEIQKKYEYALETENVFITDLKAGEINHIPQHWSSIDVLRGYKLVNKEKYYLEDALKSNARIKLDMVFLLHDRYVEFSDIYIIKELINDPAVEIKQEIQELVNHKNFAKVVKRIYSLAKIQKENTNSLLGFLNSCWGLFYQCDSDIKVLILLMKQKFKPIELKNIKKHLQIIKQNLSKIGEIKVSKIINDICLINDKDEFLKQLIQLEKSLSKVLNTQAKEFLDNLH